MYPEIIWGQPPFISLKGGDSPPHKKTMSLVYIYKCVYQDNSATPIKGRFCCTRTTVQALFSAFLLYQNNSDVVPEQQPNFFYGPFHPLEKE